MTWAQRLKRVFGIDAETCIHCGGKVKIVASVEEPNAIRAILAHFDKHGALESEKHESCRGIAVEVGLAIQPSLELRG